MLIDEEESKGSSFCKKGKSVGGDFVLRIEMACIIIKYIGILCLFIENE